MPAQYTRADSLREYLTGASSDGAAQSDPLLSLGAFRSSSEAVSFGVSVQGGLANVAVLFAGGGNPAGQGTLAAVDTAHLTWRPHGATVAGPPAQFGGTNDVEIVEALGAPGQYLRVRGTTPFTPGQCNVTLSYLYGNVFGMGELSVGDSVAGSSEYRATMLRNEGGGTVGGIKRWLGMLGTQQTSDASHLGASGAGTLSTLGTFADWPSSGWCQVCSSGTVASEVVYYSSRTDNALTVSAAGRGLLGTSPLAGSYTDTLVSTPGVAIGVDPAGPQAFGGFLQAVANRNTAPAGVTWVLGTGQATGLSVGSLGVGQQIGVWAWRHCPAGTVATPSALVPYLDSFNAF